MEKLLRGIDFPLLLMYLFLVIFGIINIYSVSADSGSKQFTWFLLAIFVGGLIFFIRPQILETFSTLFYIIGITLLILLFPLGKEINGAKAWFVFGSISLQPVEFVKIATTLVLANFINNASFNFENKESKLKVLSVILIPIFLILLQPDIGSILVFTAFFIALFREGLNGNIFIIATFIGCLFLSSIKGYINALIFFNVIFLLIILYYIYKSFNNKLFFYLFGIFLFFVLSYFFMSETISENTIIIIFIISLIILILCIYYREIYKKQFFIILAVVTLFSIPMMLISPIIFEKLPKHQKERVDVLFEGEEKYPETTGYNLLYAKTAIGSGGITGKGFNKGTVTEGGFVPEQRTDYIFCTVGEEWGFLGSTFLLIIYTCFIIRIYYLAEQKKSAFIRVIGYCMASIFLMHFTINIGMVIGLFPTVGIPLPYFSYGGSSLLAFSTMFFIFLRLNYADNRSLV